MNRIFALSALLISVHSHAAVLQHDPSSSVTYVATPETVTAWVGGSQIWTSDGVAEPTALLATSGGGAVIDALGQKLRWFDRKGKTSAGMSLSFVPGESVSHGDSVFIASRSDGALHRFERDGGTSRVAADVAAAFLRMQDDLLHAYDRVSGRIVVLDPETMRIERTFTVAPFASDFEVHGRAAYLTLPRSGEVEIVDLTSKARTERLRVGAVPLDIALAGKANALSAGEMLVADPSSKRVWREERQQSESAAFARGFTRGLIGLGLYTPKSSDFPSGIDRVVVRHGRALAFDTSTGTLYLIGTKRSHAIASSLSHKEFDVTARGEIVIWDAARERVTKLP